MSDPIEFYFDFASPYTYMAATQVDALGQRIGRDVVWRPFLLGGVFKATANVAPASVPAKGRWMFGDLHKWAEVYGVPFTFPASFPPNSLRVQRIAAAVEMDGDQERLRNFAARLFEQFWGKGHDITTEDGFRAALEGTDFDADALWARADDQTVKDHLRATTDAAVERGAFGAPTFFVGDQMFWGNDRLDMIERLFG